jgi:hypothetical protein
MHRVVSKFVPQLLTENRGESRAAICQGLLNLTSKGENFLKRIITGDETWVYGYNVETKMQSSQWVGKNLPTPKKARQVRLNMKVMLTVYFYVEGVMHHELLCQGHIVTHWYYLEVLKRLKRKCQEEKTSVVEKQLLVPPP